MKVIKEGYTYGLHNVENPQLKGQIIQFIEIEQSDKLTKTIENGISLEEYLEVAFAKARFDNKQTATSTNTSTREKANAITAIETAILWLKRDKEVNS